jgi:suppressor for copper-sensitivity B
MQFPRLIYGLCFIIAGLLNFVQEVEAQSYYSSKNPEFSVRLLSSVTALGKAHKITMGLHFKLAPSWKMSAPVAKNTSSDFLIAPQIKWIDSQNIEKIDFLWPPAHKYNVEGLEFYAYKGEFVIPFIVKVKNPEKSAILKLKLGYSLCSSVCLPITHDLTFTLNPGPSFFTTSAPLLQKSLESVMTGINPSASDTEKSFLIMLFFAFLGGVILNFMPCVLPVISLKIMSVVKKGRIGAKELHFRPSFLATFAGIMFSFIILGGIAVLLDTLGESIGWGLHFQQPSFLCFLVIITTLFANNFWGFYDIELPLFIRDWIGKLLGYEHEHHAGLVEDFVAGIFATLLATPCTAPFLGTALGYAFSRSGGEIFLFFMVLGLGFSLPYWLGAILPPAWLKLPKPGAWMLKLSHTLGYILALTSLWLLWLLSETSSGTVAFYVGLGSIGMTFAFWIGKKKKHPLLRVLNIFFMVGMLATPFIVSSPSSIHPVNSEQWEGFRPHLIPHLIKKGKVVFVDVTASWCLTCKLNKALVLDSKEGEKILSQKDIILMRADWTKPNPLISNYLSSYNRAGIPFNIIFGAGAPEGIILPEILTIESLKNALHKARRRS